jgi:hypothetical protein
MIGVGEAKWLGTWWPDNHEWSAEYDITGQGYCMGLRRWVVLAGASFSMIEETSRRLRTSGARAAAIAALSYSLANRAFALFTWCQKTNCYKFTELTS